MERRTRGREWASALFEGEGSVCLVRNMYARATVKMIDEQEVRDFHGIVGIGRVYVRTPPAKEGSTKTTWSWVVQTKAEVEELYRIIGPWLGDRRRAAFERTIAQARGTNRSGSAKQRNHAVAPPPMPLDRFGQPL